MSFILWMVFGLFALVSLFMQYLIFKIGVKHRFITSALSEEDRLKIKGYSGVVALTLIIAVIAFLLIIFLKGK